MNDFNVDGKTSGGYGLRYKSSYRAKVPELSVFISHNFLIMFQTVEFHLYHTAWLFLFAANQMSVMD
jgi:hypothetical protein